MIARLYALLLARLLHYEAGYRRGFMAGSDSLVGTIVGPYRIERQLGRGGMGAVYLARTRAGERVALKILHQHLGYDKANVERFRREADAGSKLQHPAILRTLGAGEMGGGYHYFAMEYFRGRSLDDLIPMRERFTEAQTLTVGYRMATALEYAHRKGVLHRDIKPGNVMVNRHGEVRVTDFGLAHWVGDRRLTMTGSFVGTPAYCPPEQLRGHDVDGRADIYALGISMYEMLMGRPPYVGQTPFETMQQVLESEPAPIGSVRKDVSTETLSIVEALIERDLEKRTAFATQAVDLLSERIRQMLDETKTNEGFEDALRREARSIVLDTTEVQTDAPGQATQQDRKRASAETLPGGPAQETQPITPAPPPPPPASASQETVTLETIPTVEEEEAALAAEVESPPTVIEPVVSSAGSATRWLPALLGLGVFVGLATVWALGLHIPALMPTFARLTTADTIQARRITDISIYILGPRAVPELQKRLPDADVKQRQAIFSALRRIENDAVREPLLSGLEDDDPVVRKYAAQGLVRFSDPEVRAALVMMLDDPDSHVRLAALPVVAQESSSETLETLADAFLGARGDEFRSALSAQIAVYGPDALPLLEERWAVLDQNNKRAVLQLIQRIGTPEATALLLRLLDEPQRAVRFFVVEALRETTGQPIGDDAAAWRAWAAQQPASS